MGFIKRLLSLNGFVGGVLAAVILAWLIPEAGASGGWLKSEFTTRAGVFIIFLLTGLGLPTEELRRGLLAWQLHLFVQLANFVLVPAIALAALALLGDSVDPTLRIGFLYLAMLPTTVSTAIVFSTQARGNVAGAIFNTTLSNVLGIFIVPAWAAWLLSGSTGEPIPVGPLLVNIARLLLLPLIIGQALRPWLKDWAKARKKLFGRINTTIIYFIIFAAFSNAVKDEVWAGHGTGIVVSAVGGALLLLLAVMALVYAGIRLVRFPPDVATTAFFCGSQKTLAAGVPMAQSIWAAAAAGSTDPLPALGIVLLPIMFYHPLQILIGGIFVGMLEKRAGGR